MPTRKFELPTVRYILIFWQDEQTYEMLPSSSTFFRSGTDATTLKDGADVILKDGSHAKVITTGEDPNDVKRLLIRLERRLGKGLLDASRDSLGFLNSTSASEPLNASLAVARVDENEEGEEEEDQATNDSTRADEEHDVAPDLIDDGSTDSDHQKDGPMQVQLLRTLVRQNRAILKTMNSILKEMKKSNKKGAPMNVSTPIAIDSVVPVIYKDQDLMTSARRNATPSCFGTAVARCLWEEEELATGRIGVTYRNTGRPPLDQQRQQLWYRACEQRFGEDDGKLEEATQAVNQLGLDLKHGRRRRLPPKQ